MDPNQATSTRLFPRGTTALALATAFAALGHFMALACLYPFVTDALGLSADEGQIAWNLYTAATVVLYVVGGLWGDFGGHRRNLIIGPAITVAALFLLMITPDSADAGAALLAFFALSAFACGRSLFSVASGALAAHLFEGGGGRVPLAGSFTLLHVAANAAVLLLVPFTAGMDGFLGDALGMSRDESRRLLFALAAQPAIGALIVGAVVKRTFAAAELDARAKARARDASRLEDGAVGYRLAAVGLLVAAGLLGFAAYDTAMDAAFDLGSRLGGNDGGWFGVLQLLNCGIVVFLGPVAVILYGRMRRRGGRVPTAGVAVVGAALVGLGLTLLLAAQARMPAATSEFAPPWLEDAPSIAWPVLAQILVSLGEILFIPILTSLFASLAPRRFRGLFVGLALAAAGAAALSTRLLGILFDGLPAASALGIALGAALACAALLAVVGTVFRTRSSA